MKRLSYLIPGLVCGAAAGIAFVLACGDGGGMSDAGAADASGSCATCEPPLAGRIYTVRTECKVADIECKKGPVVVAKSVTLRPSMDTGAFWAVASCEEGDTLLGGGCWYLKNGAVTIADVDDGKSLLIGAGTPPPGLPTVSDAYDVRENQYHCLYKVPSVGMGDPDMRIVAHATCYHPAE